MKPTLEFFRAVFEAAPDAIVITDPIGRIVLVNSQTEKLFGYDRKDLLGKPVETLVPERFSTSHQQHRTGFSQNPRVRPMGAGIEIYGCRQDGTEFPVDIALSPFSTKDGVFVAASVRDLTDRKEIEERLHQQELLAKLGATAAVLAHEIANPLTGVSTSLEALKMFAQGLSEEVRNTIEGALFEITRLKSLLNDYRAFARPQRLELQPTDLRKLAEAVLASQLRRYQSAGVKVYIKFEDHLPLVMVDPEKIRQVLLNLCHNAVEAMPNGGTLTVSGSQQKDKVLITVSDSGTGIPPDLNVFQLFRTTKSEGTGLGLAIVQKIVFDHRGTVDYRTEIGNGTTFRVVLPLSN